MLKHILIKADQLFQYKFLNTLQVFYVSMQNDSPNCFILYFSIGACFIVMHEIQRVFDLSL